MRAFASGFRILPLVFACLLFACLCAPALAQPDPLEYDNQLELLTNERPETRRQAVEKLIELRNPDAIEPLIGMLRDPEPQVWQQLTWGLQNFPRELVWKPLLLAMGESEEEFQPRYVQAMQNFGGDVRPLLHAMANPSARLRAGVLRALDNPQYITDARVKKIVIDALVDAEPLVRAAAVPLAVHISTGNFYGSSPYDGNLHRVRQVIAEERRIIRNGNVTIRPAPGVSPPKPDNSLLNSLILSRAFDMDARVRAAVAANVLNLDDSRAEGVVRAACGDVDEKVRAAAYGVLLERKKINIDQMLAALKDEAALVRQKALRYADGFNDPRVKEFIVSYASDIDPQVRKESLLRLGVLKDSARVKTLALAALKDDSPEVRAIAVQTLLQNGHARKWLPELEPLLKDEKLEVKRAAARALVAAHDRARGDQYFAMLDDPDIANDVIPALGSLRDKRVAPRLIAMLNEDQPDERKWERMSLISSTLARLGPDGDDMLVDIIDDPKLAEAVSSIYYTLLPRADERILPKLEAMLKGEDQQMKQIALQSLVMLRDATMEDPLLKEFARPDAGDDMFYTVIQLMHGTQNPQAAKLLVEMSKPGGKLDDGEMRWMRENVYQALARMEDPAAVDFMIGRLRSKDTQLQSILNNNYYGGYGYPNSSGFFGKGFMNDPRIIPIVLQAMTAPKPAAPAKPAPTPAPQKNKRWVPPPPPSVNAMLASQGWNILAAIKSPGAKNELAAALQGADTRVRDIAACALGRFDKAAATPVLLPLLADKDIFLRRRAAETLAGFADYRALAALSTLLQREKNLDARKKLVTAMAKIGPPAVPVLLKALEGEKGDQSTTPGGPRPGYPYPAPPPGYPMPMMNQEYHHVYSDGSLYSHIISTLAKMRDPRVTAAFEKMAKDKDVVKAFGALQALIDAKYPQIFDLLIGALNHPNENVRYFAASQLAIIGDARAIKPLRKAQKVTDEQDAILTALITLKDPAAIDEALKMFEPKMLAENPNSIRLLGATRDKRAYDLLMPLLDRVRAQRRESMSGNYYGRYEGMSYREPGMGIDFARDEDIIEYDTSLRIITALGNIGDARAAESLIEALSEEIDGGLNNRYWSPYESGNNQYVNSYIEALGNLGDRRAVEPIIDALGATRCDAGVAAVALAKLGDSRAVPAILRAAHAWEMIRAWGGGYPAAEDTRIPQSLAGFHDEASAGALKAALANGMWRTRIVAARALAYRNDPWCAEALLPLLADPQPQIRAAATQSLARLKATVARPEIEKLKTDRYPEVRDAAEKALREIGK